MKTHDIRIHGFSHNAIDSMVASIANFCERVLHREKQSEPEIAFTDEWERKQMLREFHTR